MSDFLATPAFKYLLITLFLQMDIQMPVMDGIQATKEIRRLEKSNAAAGYPPLSPTSTDDHSTPGSVNMDARPLNSPYHSSVIIVALTASSLQSDRVAALAAGCNDFLTKPVSLLWLNNKIIEWGSIKALQMWADIRPDNVKNLTTGQEAQARSVAENLHVPKDRVANSSAVRRSSSVLEENAAVLALASAGSSSSFMSTHPLSAGAPNIPSQLPNTFNQSPNSIEHTRKTSMDAASIRTDIESHPIKRKRSSLDNDDG